MQADGAGGVNLPFKEFPLLSNKGTLLQRVHNNVGILDALDHHFMLLRKMIFLGARITITSPGLFKQLIAAR